MNAQNLDLEDLISGADSTPSYTFFFPSYTFDLEQVSYLLHSQFLPLQNKSNNSTSSLGCSKD